MDFEKAYQKFLEGTATQEEIDFVREEMNKAKALNDIIDTAQKDGTISKAEKEEVKKAVKSFSLKETIRTLIIVLCSLVVLTGITLGAIFIPACSKANKNLHFDETQVKEIAVAYVKDKSPTSADKVAVRKIEKEFEVEGRIKNAHYVYVLDVYNGKDSIYEIEIDGRTGDIIQVDLD